MSKDYQVVLSYPVTEDIDGLGTVQTTRCERWHFDIYGDAWDQYKLACARLLTLGLFAQVDLLSQGHVTRSEANLPDAPLEHPLVDELARKLRNEGRLR